MKIQKTTMTFTFLHPAEDNLGDWSTDQIFDECDSGAFVGAWGNMTTVDVPDEHIRQELEVLGNDGTFFDEELSSGIQGGPSA